MCSWGNAPSGYVLEAAAIACVTGVQVEIHSATRQSLPQSCPGARPAPAVPVGGSVSAAAQFACGAHGHGCRWSLVFRSLKVDVRTLVLCRSIAGTRSSEWNSSC